MRAFPSFPATCVNTTLVGLLLVRHACLLLLKTHIVRLVCVHALCSGSIYQCVMKLLYWTHYYIIMWLNSSFTLLLYFALAFVEYLLLPHLFPLLCGVEVSYETPPFSPVLRVIPGQLFSLRDVVPHAIQPPPFWSSCPSFPRQRHHHRSLAYVFVFSSQYMPYHFNVLSCNFLDMSPTFVVPLILSFLILSSLDTAQGSAPYIIAEYAVLFYRRGLCVAGHIRASHKQRNQSHHLLPSYAFLQMPPEGSVPAKRKRRRQVYVLSAHR